MEMYGTMHVAEITCSRGKTFYDPETARWTKETCLKAAKEKWNYEGYMISAHRIEFRQVQG